MRISLKVLGFLWLGLFLIIGGLLFNAYSKFKPESFVALFTEQVQKNYPGAKLEFGNISYRYSLDFNLNLQKIHLRRSDKILGSIGEVELKVPWWLLLFNRGNAHITIKDLDIFVDHSEVMKSSKTDIPPGPSSGDMIQVSLPSYLADAKFTLRAKNIAIRDINNARRYFVLSKLLVREFHYGKNSAFELNIPVSITQNDIKYSSELWLFGDVTPDPLRWMLNFRGEFRTKENSDKFQIEDILIGGKASFAPSSLEVSSDVKLEIDKRIVGSGTLNVDQEQLYLQLDLQRLPLSYFGFIYNEIKNPYLKNLQGEAVGNISFQKKNSKSFADLSGKLNFDGVFEVSPDHNTAGKWQVSFEGSKWEVSFMSPKGEMSFFRRSFVDPKKNKITQYVEELGFSGVEVSNSLTPVASVVKFIDETSPLYFSTTISYKNCFFNNQVIKGEFKYGNSPLQRFYQGELTGENSSYRVNFLGKASQKSLEVDFNNFKWDTAFTFLVPIFTAEKGVLNGKASGRWKEAWESGQWLVDLNMDQLEKTQGKLPDFIKKSFSYFTLDPNDFSTHKLSLVGKNDVISLNSLSLDSSESVKLSGQLSTRKKSFLTLTYPKRKDLKPSKKEIIEPYWMQKDEI